MILYIALLMLPKNKKGVSSQQCVVKGRRVIDEAEIGRTPFLEKQLTD